MQERPHFCPSYNAIAESLLCHELDGLASQLRELMDVKATRIQAPYPIWTGVGVTELGVPGALLELSAVAVARDLHR